MFALELCNKKLATLSFDCPVTKEIELLNYEKRRKKPDAFKLNVLFLINR